jgi:hypothetical protein
MQTLELTEGWEAAIEYDLLHDGIAFNATGYTPSMVLKDKTGAVVTTTGNVEWADDDNSRIRYNPDATDLDASLSPYTLHWKVTDAAGKDAFYPQGSPIIVRVYEQ